MRVATPTFSGALPTLFLLVLPRGRRVCLLISLTHTFRRRASRSPTNSVRLRLHATRPRSTILGSYAASIPNQGQAPMLPSGACSHASVSHALACLSLVSAVSAQNTPPRLASAKCSCRTFARVRALLQGLVPAVQLPCCADWHSQPPDLVLGTRRCWTNRRLPCLPFPARCVRGRFASAACQARRRPPCLRLRCAAACPMCGSAASCAAAAAASPRPVLADTVVGRPRAALRLPLPSAVAFGPSGRGFVLAPVTNARVASPAWADPRSFRARPPELAETRHSGPWRRRARRAVCRRKLKPRSSTASGVSHPASDCAFAHGGRPLVTAEPTGSWAPLLLALANASLVWPSAAANSVAHGGACSFVTPVPAACQNAVRCCAESGAGSRRQRSPIRAATTRAGKGRSNGDANSGRGRGDRHAQSGGECDVREYGTLATAVGDAQGLSPGTRVAAWRGGRRQRPHEAATAKGGLNAEMRRYDGTHGGAVEPDGK
ncbi:hypothetical protein ERJ75_000658700 [Trypanosoma vivax]|nr:hypothetical protein ERJ75_000658700 [Trypanosoma vivax]